MAQLARAGGGNQKAGAAGPEKKARPPSKSAERKGRASHSLELEIRDFGPILNADIRLRPLTVFIGPNNSGKSYAAMLAHSAVAALGRRSAAGLYGPHARLHPSVERSHPDHAGLHLGGPDKNEFVLTGAALEMISDAVGSMIASTLVGQIERNFGRPAADLARLKRPRFAVSLRNIVEVSMPRNRRGHAAVKSHITGAVVKRLLTTGSHGGMRARAKGGNGVLCTLSGGSNEGNQAHPPRPAALLSAVHAALLSSYSPAIPAASHYLPATRTGIIESLGAALPAIVRNAPQGRGDAAPPLPKAVDCDFLAAMLEINVGRKRLLDVAEKLEREAIHGKIEWGRFDGPLPDIRYVRQQAKMPLSHASSAVLELAPFILFLKHVVQRGDLLVVEEPESHLHPEAQVVLAECIVRLVRAGLNVVVTTHSTYMLERFSAHLRASAMTPAERQKAGIGRNAYLKAGDVAPYLFALKGDRTAVKAIDFSPREGISQEEFMRVNEALHDQNARAEELVG